MAASTAAGCATDRMYDTGLGALGSVVSGLAAGGGTFSGGAGSNSDRNKETDAGAGIGGVAKKENNTESPSQIRSERKKN